MALRCSISADGRAAQGGGGCRAQGGARREVDDAGGARAADHVADELAGDPHGCHRVDLYEGEERKALGSLSAGEKGVVGSRTAVISKEWRGESGAGRAGDAPASSARASSVSSLHLSREAEFPGYPASPGVPRGSRVSPGGRLPS